MKTLNKARTGSVHEQPGPQLVNVVERSGAHGVKEGPHIASYPKRLRPEQQTRGGQPFPWLLNKGGDWGRREEKGGKGEIPGLSTEPARERVPVARYHEETNKKKTKETQGRGGTKGTSSLKL